MDNDVQGASGADKDKLRADRDRANMVAELTVDLHDVYDVVLTKTLPIYFGPVLGELFLVGR